MAQVMTAGQIVKRPTDFVLACTFFVLVSAGLAMLFSASYFRSQVIYGDPLRFFLSQAAYAALGVVLVLVLARISLDAVRKFLPFLLLLSFALMLLTFVPGFGAEFLGGRRWINILGMSFQPSELVKLSLILYLASVLERKQHKMDAVRESLIPPFLIVFFFVVLIFLQNNFSTASFVLVIALSIFYAAGVKYRYFALTLLMVVPLLIGSLLTKEHRLERLLTFIKPGQDPMGSGYQILTSIKSLRSGGFLGHGMGQGVQKLGALPEAQSDFIFAVLGEELGFVGVVAVIVLFGLLAWRGYRASFKAPDTFRKLLAFGLTTCLILQAMINVAVVSSLIPATGIPLPFFSSGGSSLLVSMMMVGLLLNISRSSVEKEAGLVG